MRRWFGQLAGALGGVLLLSEALAFAAKSSLQTVFVVPPELRSQVEFWKSIFATYSERQVLIHDTEHLDRVYSVLDFRGLAEQVEERGRLQRVIADAVDAEKERIRALLVRLHQADGHLDGLAPEEAKIARLFGGDGNPRRFLDAASPDRIRAQPGLRERFAAGIEVGHRYFPEMEAIFASEGVPIELTRLPLVESCFNVRAYSKVGAAGIWQFMPSTGRRFLRVDAVIDERRDPIESTRAAALFLRENYERLGTWPLALKAYNHGPAGISRAVRELGTTDIVRIIKEYHGPAFKFASRNFYPEFLAALEVERNRDRYFGQLALGHPVRTEAIPLRQPISIRLAAELAGTDRDVLSDLNPSLSPLVEDGRRAIPAGYPLRLPAGTASRFSVRYADHVSRSAVTERAAQRTKGKVVRVARRSASKKQVSTSRSNRPTRNVGKATQRKRVRDACNSEPQRAPFSRG